MVAQLERHRVGKAARFGNLIGGQIAAGHRHLEILANLARRVGGKGKLDLGLMRHRARGACQDEFECFEGGLLCHNAPSLSHSPARVEAFHTLRSGHRCANLA